MKREDDPELWDTLAKGTSPALSPFFARNVLRQVREERSWRANVVRWLRPRALIPASAIALVLLVSGISLHSKLKSEGAADNPPETVAVIEPQDYEVVADLDDLLASDDDNVWDENDTLSL